MAIVPGCEYDVFISHAHIDNEDAWVVKFAEKLTTALARRLGDTRELAIFWDKNNVRGGNTRLPELLAAARSSGCFLAIGSPSYIVRNWPLEELKEFSSSHPDLGRVFLIEVMPLAKGDAYPAPLHDIISLQFWKDFEQTRLPLAFHSDLEDITRKVHVLADTISKKLRALRLLPEPPAVPRFVQTPANQANRTAGTEKKTVLLAQPTEDVDEEMDQVRSFLQQYGDEIRILPSSGYPQGGDAFRAAFYNDLVQADYVVQLLGRRAGRTPPDLPEGYTFFQAEAAKTARAKLLQWRRPDLDSESIPDPYKKLLKSEKVIACGLEAFKQQILKEVHNEEERQKREEEKKQRKQERTGQGWIGSSMVFINADARDKLIAKKVERECIDQLPTFHSQEGPLSDSVLKDLTENLIDCDLLLFIYGETTEDWIRAQCRFFNKVRKGRKTEPKLLAICSGPGSKPDIGINFPNAHLVECLEWNLEPVRKLIQQAGQ